MIDDTRVINSFFQLQSFIIENNLEVAALLGITIYVLGFYYLIGKYYDYVEKLNIEKQYKYHTLTPIITMISLITILEILLHGFFILVIYILLALFFKLVYFNERYKNFREKFEELF